MVSLSNGKAGETFRSVHSLTDVLALLQRVRSLRFEAHSEGTTGWNGVGTGSVDVSEPAAGIVVFDEAGTWQPSIPARPALGFQNVFRWSVAEGALRLEHLRFGPAHCYTASLSVEGEQLVVAWSIIGPHKRELIRYTYW